GMHIAVLVAGAGVVARRATAATPDRAAICPGLIFTVVVSHRSGALVVAVVVKLAHVVVRDPPAPGEVTINLAAVVVTGISQVRFQLTVKVPAGSAIADGEPARLRRYGRPRRVAYP